MEALQDQFQSQRLVPFQFHEKLEAVAIHVISLSGTHVGKDESVSNMELFFREPQLALKRLSFLLLCSCSSSAAIQHLGPHFLLRWGGGGGVA